MSGRCIDASIDEVEACGRSRAGRRHTSPSGRRRDGAPCTATPSREFAWASVTKLATALACSSPPRRGRRARRAGRPARLDGAPPARARVRLPLEAGTRRSPRRGSGGSTRTRLRGARRARRRGARRCRSPTYLRDAVLEPLGMHASSTARPASGVVGSLDDLLAVARELLAPTLVAPETLGEATTVQFPGLVGVLPGLRPPGAERLGPRLRASRREVAALDGHAQLAADVRPLRPQRHVPLGRPRSRASRSAASPTCDFGDWAKEAWPALSDAVLEA